MADFTDHLGSNAQPLRAFKLERYFAAHEFVAPRLLCCSDCEPLTLRGLLAQASPPLRRLYDDLGLGYTESRGHPLLLQAIAALLRWNQWVLTTFAQVRPESSSASKSGSGLPAALGETPRVAASKRLALPHAKLRWGPRHFLACRITNVEFLGRAQVHRDCQSWLTCVGCQRPAEIG